MVIIGSGKAAMAVHASALTTHADVIILDYKDTISTTSVRRAGKTETIAQVIQLTAIREDLYEIELREKQIIKQTWNKNRQRNLRHHPGRRWIDLRTMNK